MKENYKSLFNDIFYEDDIEDDSDFIVNTDKNIIEIFNGKPIAKYMNKYNNVGDILTYDIKTNFFYILKNNSYIKDIKIDKKKYGKVIGICVGKGLWLATEYDYTVLTHWCEDYVSDLYNDKLELNSDGYHNTKYILKYYRYDIFAANYNIFYDLYNLNITGLGKHVCYLPNIFELQEICENNNKIQLPKSAYFSSSVPTDKVSHVYIQNFIGHNLYSNYKNSNYNALALLHFKK